MERSKPRVNAVLDNSSSVPQNERVFRHHSPIDRTALTRHNRLLSATNYIPSPALSHSQKTSPPPKRPSQRVKPAQQPASSFFQPSHTTI